MLKETFTVMRDLPRVREIVAILIRYGLGNLVQKLGLNKGIERASDALHLPGDHEITLMDPAVRVRKALEELGPTFIKLGQVLATRVDMFTPEWIAEFEKLQNEVPPLDFALLLPELQQVLGMTPELFAKLQPFITIYSGLARPNPSFAPPEVLAALGLQAPQIAQLLAQREAWQPGMPVFTLPDGNPLATSGTGTYSISSLAIESDGSRAEISAILRVGSNGNFGQLYTPLAWRVGAND